MGGTGGGGVRTTGGLLSDPGWDCELDGTGIKARRELEWIPNFYTLNGRDGNLSEGFIDQRSDGCDLKALNRSNIDWSKNVFIVSEHPNIRWQTNYT